MSTLRVDNGRGQGKGSGHADTILFVHSGNDMYGADLILLKLLQGLDKSRFYPIVALPRDSKHINRLAPKLEKAGIEYRFIRMPVLRRKYFTITKIIPWAFDFMVGILALAILMKRRRIAMVHSNTLAVPCGAIAAALRRKPHLWHLHEIIVDPVTVRKIMHVLACYLSDAVIAVSGPVREHVLRDCPSSAGKIKIVHNGIDPAPFFEDSSKRAQIRREFSVPSGAVLVGMVGRVSRWKGQLVFLAAAQQALKLNNTLYFVAVGGVFDDEIEYMDRLRRSVQESGIEARFAIIDYRPDISDVMQAFDIFVLPSTLPDPFPTVILEAMAAAKPVIATAHGGSIEMVKDGTTGYLISPNDSGALAQAILVLAGEKKRTVGMGTEGRKRLLEEFQQERFISDFELIYSGLLSQREMRAPIREQVYDKS